MPAIISKAPGKIILFGEHAVVYGYPAIAVPIDAVQVRVTILPVITENQSIIKIRNIGWHEDIPFAKLDELNPIRTSAENVFTHINQKPPRFEMTISSSIPIAAGLGSSAALAVAITKGMSQFLGIYLSNDEVNALAYKSEEIQHGSPSGIDNSVVTLGQPILFIKSKSISQIKIRNSIHIILADTGKRTLTREVVAFVKQNLEKQPDFIKPILAEIGGVVKEAAEALLYGEIKKLGSLMVLNQIALKKLGVSSIELDRLVESAIKNGALGAKLCGGGKGGYMVAICEPASCERVSSGLVSDGATHIISTTIKGSKQGN
jgi:mevalonate kinase